jgi:hypothetical protein
MIKASGLEVKKEYTPDESRQIYATQMLMHVWKVQAE